MYVDFERCTGCGKCISVCPVDAISIQENKASIEETLCADCRACQTVCPEDAILIMEIIDPIAVAEPEPAAMSTALEMAPAAKQAIAPARDTAIFSALIDAVPRLISLAVDWLEHRSRPNKDVKPRDNAPVNQNASPRNEYRRGTGQQKRGGQGKGRRQHKRRNR